MRAAKTPLEVLLSDMRQYGSGSDDNYRAFALAVGRHMSEPGANWTEVLASAFQAVADHVNADRDEAAAYANLTEPY